MGARGEDNDQGHNAVRGRPEAAGRGGARPGRPGDLRGSFLLGVKGPVVIGHGNSRARGVENAILGLSRAGSGIVEESEKALALGQGRAAGGRGS